MSRRSWVYLHLLFFTAVSLLLFSQAMFRPLDHDEHQFVAGAVMIAQNGLTPYRDFAFFHMPYLILLNAFLFGEGSFLLLKARLLSALFSVLSLLLIYLKTYQLTKTASDAKRFLVPAAAVMVYLNCQLFAYTTGLAWNHDSATFFALGAFLFFLGALRDPQKRAAALASGLFLAIATGIRLSFAPLFAPFFMLPWFYRRNFSRKHLWQLLGGFSLGYLLGMLPAIYYFLQSPDAFLFGNFGYPTLNTLYRQDIGFTRGMNIGLKLLLLGEVFLQPGNLFILIAAILLGWKKRFLLLARKHPGHAEPFFILLMIPFVLLGAFAPTPAQLQYFYPVLFWMALVPLYGLIYFNSDKSTSFRKTVPLGILLGILALPGLSQYPNLYDLPKDHKWETVINHRIGKEMGQLLRREAIVLTLAPIPVLEGELSIYPELATGPFAYRTAKFLSREDRERYHFTGPADLEVFLKEKPPHAILTGYEWRDDCELEEYARKHGYRLKQLSNGKLLWIKP